MGFYLTFKRFSFSGNSTFTHNRLSNDYGGLICSHFCLTQSISNRLMVITYNGLNVPTPGFIFSGSIFICNIFDPGRKLNVVSIIKKD